MLTRLLALTLLLLPFRLDAGQGVWTPAGPEGGIVTELAVAPNGRTVYAGTPAGGVFKSFNRGRSWVPVHRGIDGGVNDLEVDPTRSQIVYAATSKGLFKSLDAGASWTDLTFRLPRIGSPPEVLAVALSPTEPGTVYVSLLNEHADPLFYRSSDDGATWLVLTTLPGYTVRTIAIHPSRPGVVYVGMKDGIYRSFDSGRTWRRAGLAGHDIERLAFDPLQPARLYAVRLVEDGRVTPGETEVYVSERERTWRKVSAGLEGSDEVDFVADPFTPGTAYLGTSRSLFKTTDGGRTWQTVLELVFPLALAANPRVPGMLFLGRPGPDATAVLRSTDTGTSWTASASGIQAHVARGIVAATPGVFYTRASCCGGPWKTLDGGRTWASLEPALPPARFAVDIAVDPARPTDVYVSLFDGRLFRSGDAGATWSEIANYQSTGAMPITDLRFDPLAPGTLYGILSLSNQILPGKSSDGGAHWTPLLPQTQDFSTSVLSIAPGPPTALYANGSSYVAAGGYREDRVMRSMDGGSTWTTLFTARDKLFTDFAADPRLPGRILASFIDDMDFPPSPWGGVYLSTDGGLHWERIKVTDLLNPPIFSLALDPRQPLRVYAGGAGAVFLSEDGGATWTSISTGLPPGKVVDLQVDPHSPDTVYAALSGGSVYTFTRTAGH